MMRDITIDDIMAAVAEAWDIKVAALPARTTRGQNARGAVMWLARHMLRLSTAEIAGPMNRTAGTVANRITWFAGVMAASPGVRRRVGYALSVLARPRPMALQPHGARFTQEEDEQIMIWAEAGMPASDMALVLRRSPASVRAHLSVRRAAAPTITPWPKDMPRFEDHPRALAIDGTFSMARARRVGRMGRYQATGAEITFSMPSSSGCRAVQADKGAI